MKRFKVLSFMSVFFLLFAGVALAQNAESVFVEVGYQCPDGQEECDTDAAVSREVGGDIVNILITLIAGNGNPATAGPNGELLGDLTVTVSTTLGENIEANEFLADASGVALGDDATARANIDYTGAQPGVDQVVVSVSSEPDALVGQASVNVIAPPATSLVVRTLRNAASPQNLYDPIPDQANNLGGWEPAGTAVPVTVLAQVLGDFTPDLSLEGKSVIVKAYADYSEDDNNAGLGGPLPADPTGDEADPIAEETFTISGGQVTGPITINNGGPVDPEGLNVVFTAEIDEVGGISSTLMNGAGLDLVPGNDFTLDTVEMRSGSPASLLVAMDPYLNGNLVMAEGCLVVFDDDAGAGGTAVPFETILVDSRGNGTLASADIATTISLNGGELETQLDPAVCGDILADAYHAGCTLQDQDPLAAGQAIRQNITVFDPADGVASGEVSTNLVPGDDPDIDLDVAVAPDGQLNASDEVILTLSAAGAYFPFNPGETLEISATGPGGAQWISTSDFANAENTLEIPATDDDGDTAGFQLPPIKIYGPCTTAPGENVTFTVAVPGRCDISADSNDILDIAPGDAANLAATGLAAPLETDSDLDVPNYVGTDPVVVDTPLVVGEGDVETDVLECGDLEVRDEFDNVLDDAPDLACAVGLGFATVTGIDNCDVAVRPVVEAIDTTQTLRCEATDFADVDGRNFSLTMIEGGAGPTGDATALVVRQEAPQDQDGNQIEPCGEAIVQIFANGDLAGDVAIRISFGEGSVEGAELRNLDADQALEEPLSENLIDGEVIRLVVYAPDGGQVNVVVEDVRVTDEPLTQGDLSLPFCGVDPDDLEVTVTCTVNDLCEGDDCTTCTAVTAPVMMQIESTYSWEINGVAAGTDGTAGGNTLEVCPEDLNDGNNTITATDTANGDIEGSATIELNGDVCGPDCGLYSIDVAQETVLRSRWLPSVALITINGIDTGWVGGLRRNFEIEYIATQSRDLFVLPGTFPFLVEASQIIRQVIILLPSWFTGCCFDGSVEIMTVEVCNTDTDCCDEDEVAITMLPLGLDQ